MKKMIAFTVVLLMALGVVGTASALDYVVKLEGDSVTGHDTWGYYASPVANDGTTVYVLASSPKRTQAGFTLTDGARAGATLFQVVPSTGVSSYFMFDTLSANNPALGFAGSTAYSTPVLWQAPGDSGVTLVMNIYRGVNDGSYSTTPKSGTSLYAIYYSPTNSGTTQWAISLEKRWGEVRGNWFPVIEPDISVTNGTSAWTTHLLIDSVDNSATGTTVYGTSGVSAFGGASLWAISLGNQTGSVRMSNNQWGPATTALNGVSTFWSAPVISGNSLFVIGSASEGNSGQSGVSILMFDKTKLQAGPNATANILGSGFGATPFATPAVAGNSIFVVDSIGGVTAYSIAQANPLGATRGSDFIQMGNYMVTSVTASPVTDGSYLVVCPNHQAKAAAGISVFQISGKQLNATNAVSWWFEFAAGTTISTTPAISNGNVYVTVNHSFTGARVYRFALAGKTGNWAAGPDQTWTADASGSPFGFVEYASPIIAANRLIFISNSHTKKRLYSLDIGTSANSYAYWRQFKADAARTGNNTVAAGSTPLFDEGSSGCFISTIK